MRSFLEMLAIVLLLVAAAGAEERVAMAMAPLPANLCTAQKEGDPGFIQVSTFEVQKDGKNQQVIQTTYFVKECLVDLYEIQISYKIGKAVVHYENRSATVQNGPELDKEFQWLEKVTKEENMTRYVRYQKDKETGELKKVCDQKK